MIKFQRNDMLEIKKNKIIKEIYELTDKNTILGYATINEDTESPIYIYVKKEHRGNRIWKNVIQ